MRSGQKADADGYSWSQEIVDLVRQHRFGATDGDRRWRAGRIADARKSMFAVARYGDAVPAARCRVAFAGVVTLGAMSPGPDFAVVVRRAVVKHQGHAQPITP
jgi:hypothetical protein